MVEVVNLKGEEIGEIGKLIMVEMLGEGVKMVIEVIIGIEEGEIEGIIVGIVMKKWFENEKEQKKEEVKEEIMVGIIEVGMRIKGGKKKNYLKEVI